MELVRHGRVCMNKKNKFARFITFSALLFIIVLLIIFNSDKENINYAIANNKNGNKCEPSIKKEIVRGSSLAPVINYGDGVAVDYNYYKCGRSIERNDIVIYNYSAQNKKIIKVVKVIPGDTFRVDTKDNTLFVNGEPIKNGRNENYILDGQGRTMIGLYEKSFNGRMNGNVYFLFGENQASIDSSAFGPVSGADILGKVIKIIPAAN